MGVCKWTATGDAPKATSGKVDEETIESTRDSIGINPIFNFDPSFVASLYSISPEELGQSVPFIDVKLINKEGEILQDLNLSFFQQTVDLDLLSSGARFADRPTMSLRDIQLRTSLASGYLFYTHVTMNIRIHAPDVLQSSTVMALLFPGAPVLLSYGWNSPNEFLNSAKETLLWSVSNYDLTMDKTGQIDLSVKGFAYSEQFDNAIIGDGNFEVTSENFDGKDLIFRNAEELKDLIEYIKELRDSSNKGTNNYKRLRMMARRLNNREEVVRGEISKRFKEKKSRLLGLKESGAYTGKGADRIESVKLHDITYTLLNDTLCDVTETMAGIDEVRFVYGRFNDKAGVLAGKSIADFPVPFRRFNGRLNQEVQKGQFVVTVKQFFNFVIREFLENKQIWNRLLSNKEVEEFLMPDVAITVNGRKIKDGNGEKGILEVLFVDIRQGVPPTTSLMPKGKDSQSVLESAVRDEKIPVVKLGHANSFIKELNVSQILDQYMKAALIERMDRDRLESVRDALVPSASLAAKPSTPLILPLRGSARVIGHPGWKPFRSFFLSSGIYVVDAIYKITNVTHTLSQREFDTSIEFIYH